MRNIASCLYLMKTHGHNYEHFYANKGGGSLHKLDVDGAGFPDSLKSVANNAFGRIK